ncbi:hypothetical protein BGZ52_001372, partial [Haplosporangium bisporale]
AVCALRDIVILCEDSTVEEVEREFKEYMDERMSRVMLVHPESNGDLIGFCSTVILALALAILSVSAAPTGANLAKPEVTQVAEDIVVMGGCRCNPDKLPPYYNLDCCR